MSRAPDTGGLSSAPTTVPVRSLREPAVRRRHGGVEGREPLDAAAGKVECSFRQCSLVFGKLRLVFGQSWRACHRSHAPGLSRQNFRCQVGAANWRSTFSSCSFSFPRRFAPRSHSGYRAGRIGASKRRTLQLGFSSRSEHCDSPRWLPSARNRRQQQRTPKS